MNGNQSNPHTFEQAVLEAAKVYECSVVVAAVGSRAAGQPLLHTKAVVIGQPGSLTYTEAVLLLETLQSAYLLAVEDMGRALGVPESQLHTDIRAMNEKTRLGRDERRAPPS